MGWCLYVAPRFPPSPHAEEARRAVSKHQARSVARPSFETPAKRGLLRMRSEYLEKRLNAGDGASQDQRVDVVGAFIGVHGFQVRGMTHHVIFDLDAVAAVHVAGHARDMHG